jgi:hypothetical protein
MLEEHHVNRHRQFLDTLSLDEADYVTAILDDFKDQAWAAPLAAAVREGGITPSNKDQMFELRFAHALHQAGIAPRYEVPGEGPSKI